MGISLFTSRMVLKFLGVEDFGIYSIVGGVIVLFSFINTSMMGATQRYLNIEMGKNDKESVSKVFCVSINIYIIIAIFVLLLGETIGLWFVNNILVIPDNRIYAVNWVYQFTILSFIVEIIKIPYHATVLAYEKMSFYAFVSIIEAILKLIILFLLHMILFDKLILYALLIFLSAIIILLTCVRYCLRNFETCKYQFVKDKKLTKEMLSFSSWNMFGNIALIGSNQGLNIILNIFYGVTINAALGIANQVNTVLYSFVTNMQTAFNPQITKTYASGDLKMHKILLFQASKFSYFLILVLAVPIIFYTDFILKIWLDTVPEYTAVFIQIIIGISLLESIAGPLWVSIYAFGKIRRYQLIISIILLLNLPFSYIILACGISPIYVFVVKFFLTLILYMYRLYFINQYLSVFTKSFLKNYWGRILLVTGVLILSAYYFKQKVLPDENLWNIIFFNVFNVFIAVFIIFTVGMENFEKIRVKNFINRKIKK
jgi:O-antigen/teichoic acid export membrane protein